MSAVRFRKQPTETNTLIHERNFFAALYQKVRKIGLFPSAINGRKPPIYGRERKLRREPQLDIFY